MTPSDSLAGVPEERSLLPGRRVDELLVAAVEARAGAERQTALSIRLSEENVAVGTSGMAACRVSGHDVAGAERLARRSSICR